MDNPSGFLLIPGLYVLLHLTGLILALVYWRRCPKPCALLLAASLLSLLGSLTRVGLLLVGAGDNFPFFRTPAASILQWIAYGLMLVAIFAGRNEPRRLPPRPLQDDDDWEPKPPTSTRDTTGIQKR
jgi:hypothetical protein